MTCDAGAPIAAKDLKKEIPSIERAIGAEGLGGPGGIGIFLHVRDPRTGAVDRIIVQSFDWRGPRRLRRTRPDVDLAWLTSAAFLAGARTWWDGPLPAVFGGSVARAVAAAGGRTWSPEHDDLTEETLAEAHALGLRVVPWTVNRPEAMRRLIRWGVDGLITDRPDLARAVLAEAGHLLPMSRRVEDVGGG